MSMISYTAWEFLYTFGIVWVLAAFSWVGLSIVKDFKSYYTASKTGMLDIPPEVEVSDTTIAPLHPLRTGPSLFSRILVPVDDSDVAEKGVNYALLLANLHSANTDVLIVYADSDAETKEKHDSISKAAKNAKNKFEVNGIRTSTIKLSSQKMKPSDAIAKVALDYDVDAIIMGTHGSGFFYGTMEEVINKVKCPVIAIPPGVAS